MPFTPGPWFVDPHDMGCKWNVCTEDVDIALAQQLVGDDLKQSKRSANAALISAAPDMFAAIDVADTAFAVLNVQDLGGQARACIREAWPLVQSARAKARPDSGYADAVTEAQQHEIARLDAVVTDLRDRLADIARVLSDCPGVETGNSKVHYAYHVALGGVE